MTKLTQQYIQSLFTYRDGELYWKVRLAKRIDCKYYPYIEVNKRHKFIGSFLFALGLSGEIVFCLIGI